MKKHISVLVAALVILSSAIILTQQSSMNKQKDLIELQTQSLIESIQLLEAYNKLTTEQQVILEACMKGHERRNSTSKGRIL